MPVPDPVLRRKLFQASTKHTPVMEMVKQPNATSGTGWMRTVCRCGWGGPGVALHEHQMDELVRAVREAYEADQLALTRLSSLVHDFPDGVVPMVPVTTIEIILKGEVPVGDDV